MKKQYILVALVLIGLGVISTMAFTLTDGPDITTAVYDITDAGASGDIDKIKVKPQGSLNKVKIDISLTDQDVAFDLDLNLLGTELDLTGATITGPNVGVYTLGSGTNILSFTGVTAASSCTITIDDSSDYGGTSTVWEDITSLLVTLADN